MGPSNAGQEAEISFLQDQSYLTMNGLALVIDWGYVEWRSEGPSPVPNLRRVRNSAGHIGLEKLTVDDSLYTIGSLH